MAQGEIYVEVDASAINGGISTMAYVSGNPEPVDGQSYVVVWIRWKYEESTGEGGYTGTGWYFDDPNNNLMNNPWNTEKEFKAWLVENQVTDLNDKLGMSWDADKKATFLNNRMGDLENGGCLYFTANTKP